MEDKDQISLVPIFQSKFPRAHDFATARTDEI